MRRHRAAYRAPSRGHYDDSAAHVHPELSVPLLVEIPRHGSPAAVSPPSSVGSADSFLLDEDDFPLPELPSPTRVVRRRPFRRRITKTFLKLYNLLLDLMLLIFVCIMGLFFDVEVQVVRQDRRRTRGSGRVVIQTGSGGGNNNGSRHHHHHHESNHHHSDYNEAYHRSTNLLRSPPASLRGGDEGYWYQDPATREEIV